MQGIVDKACCCNLSAAMQEKGRFHGLSFFAGSMDFPQASSQAWAPHLGLCDTEGQGPVLQPTAL